MVERDYIFTVQKCNWEREPNVFSLLCNSAENKWGEEIMLHNELDMTFKVVDGKIQLLDGWHVGTESFSLDPGDEQYIEQYHPGITEQIIKKMKEDHMI